MFAGETAFGRARRTAFAATDTHLLFASAAGLEIFDSTSAAAPFATGEVDDVDPSVRFVAVDGDIAVMRGESTVSLIDISQPDAPALSTSWNDPEGVLAAVSAGNRLAVRNGSALQLLDISVPDSPMMLATFDLAGDCSLCPLALSAERLFVLRRDEDTATLLVWDVSGDNLVEGDSLLLGPQAGLATLAADGVRAIAATGSGLAGEVHVVDASAPDAMVLVGTQSAGSEFQLDGGRTLAVSGNRAASAWVGLTMFDITGPPVRTDYLQSFSLPGAPIVFQGNVVISMAPPLLAGDPPETLVRADATNPASLAPLPSLVLPVSDAAGEGVGVAWFDEYLLLADERGGLRVFDASDPSAPTQIGHITTTGIVDAVLVANGRAWMRENNSWTAVIVDDPTAPTRGEPLIANPSGGVFAGDLYIEVGFDQIRIFDVSGGDPGPVATFAPVPPDGTEFPLTTRAIVVGDRLVLSGQSFHWIYDIADPASPTELAVHELSALSPVVAVGDRLLSGRDLLSLEDPMAPSIVGTLPDTGVVRGITVGGDRVYEAVVVAQDPTSLIVSSSIAVIDVSDPTSPQLAATLPFIDEEDGPLRLGVDASGLLAIPKGNTFFQIVDADCDP
jgi:hypothetical protein